MKIDASIRILQFFLDKLQFLPGGAFKPALFVHFEVIPDHLPDKLKEKIAEFPPGVLQFEIGIQSFNVDVQQRISRRQDNAKTEANIAWLVTHSNAHLHTDLIFGLPGESMASFAQGFDRLFALHPHEIQLGVLKRLRGTPISRHTQTCGMVYDLAPPYTVQQTGAVSAADMQRFVRLARYWDLLANSGRFKQTLQFLLRPSETNPSPFQSFLALSDWLWQTIQTTCQLTPEALVDALFLYLTDVAKTPEPHAQAMLLADYLHSGARARPQALQAALPGRHVVKQKQTRALVLRQSRHEMGGESLAISG